MRPPLKQFLSSLCAASRLAPAALQFAALSRYREDWTEYSLIAEAFPAATLRSAEKLIATLGELGLLTDAETFDAVPLPNFATRSLLELVYWRLASVSPAVRDETARLLMENKDSRFGHHLFAALLGTGESPAKTRGLDMCSASFARVRKQVTGGAILNVFQIQFPSLAADAKAEGELVPFAPLLQLRTTTERAYLDAVLAGKTSIETPYRDYRLVVTRELASLMKSARREDALSLVQGMHSQLDPRNTAEGFHRRDGEGLSSFLTSTLFSNGLADAPSLLACLMHSAARLPEVRLLPDRLNSEGLGESRSLLFSIWERRGGWAAPGLVFDQLMQEMASHGIEQTRGLWLPLLYDALMRMGPLEGEELSKWASRQDHPGLKIVGDEIRLAQSLIAVTEPLLPAPGARIPALDNATKKKQWAGIAHSAAELLGNEQIAPHVSLSLAAWFCAIFPGLLDDEVRQTRGLAAAKAWNEGKIITRFEIESLLNSASVLPINETWQQTRTLTLDYWNRREEAFRKSGRRYTEPGFFPLILRFAVRSDDTKTLDWFVSQEGDYSPGHFNGILLEAGDWPHADQIKLLEWQKAWSFTEEWEWWLPPSEKALQQMQAAGEKSLLAEVMAPCGDDTATRLLYPAARWPSREERLASFGKRLAALPLPPVPMERAPSLVLLGRECPAAALSLVSQYDSIAKILRPDSLGNDSTGTRLWADFLAVHAALKIARGDVAAAEATWKTLGEGDFSRSDSITNKARFRSTFFRCLVHCLSSGLARDPEKLLKLSAFAEPSPNQYYDGGPSLPAVQACLKAWLAALKAEPLPEKPGDRLPEADDVSRLAGVLSAISGEGKDRLSFEQRLHLFAQVSGRISRSESQNQIWPLLVNHGVFTTEELTENAASVARCFTAMNSRHFEYHALLLREKGFFEAAAHELGMLLERFAWEAESKGGQKPQSSLMGTPAGSTSQLPITANLCLLEQVECLIRLKNFTEARDQLARFNTRYKTGFIFEKREALLELLPGTPTAAK